MVVVEAKRIGLFLARKDEAQLGWAAAAHEATHGTPHTLIEYWSEGVAGGQTRQVSEAVWQDQVDALLIMPASLGGPAALLPQAVARGKVVILLNRTANDLDLANPWSLVRLRREHPTALVVRVAPDEPGVGHIQAEQVRAILPAGGSVLYVRGDTRTSGAADRAAGFDEALAGDARFRVGRVDGMWSAEVAERAVIDWGRVVLADAAVPLDLVVSQSDVMLSGIRGALRRLADELQRPHLAALPLTGCDGSPQAKESIRRGLLAATVEMPDRVGPAVRVCIDFWEKGDIPPNPDVRLPGRSFPPLPDIVPSR